MVSSALLSCRRRPKANQRVHFGARSTSSDPRRRSDFGFGRAECEPPSSCFPRRGKWRRDREGIRRNIGKQRERASAGGRCIWIHGCDVRPFINSFARLGVQGRTASACAFVHLFMISAPCAFRLARLSPSECNSIQVPPR